MARPKRETGRAAVPFRCEPDLAARLKVYAETEGLSLNRAIEALLDRALKVRGL